MQNNTETTQQPTAAGAKATTSPEEIPEVVKEEEQQERQTKEEQPTPVLTPEEEAQLAAYKAEKAKPFYVRMGDTISEVFTNISKGIDNAHRKTSEAFGTSPASCGLPPSEGGPSCVFHRPREHVQPTPEQLAVYQAQQERIAAGEPVEGTVLHPEEEVKPVHIRLGDTVGEAVEGVGKKIDNAHRKTSEAFGTTPASCGLPPSEGGPSCALHRPASQRKSAEEQRAKVQAIQQQHPYEDMPVLLAAAPQPPAKKPATEEEPPHNTLV